MTKTLMISIQPQHAVNILNGNKTLELRTWIPKDYVGWVYVYVTKGKRLSVVHDDENGKTYYYLNSNWGRSLNQDIPFRFWFYGYETLEIDWDLEISTIKRSHEELLEKSCVDYNTLNNMFMNENGDVFGYAWHIKQLEIFDEPKELSEFYKGNRYPNGEIITPNICEFSSFDYDNDLETCFDLFRLKKAPQRSVWVYTKELEK